jgi:hypothetical protein
MTASLPNPFAFETSVGIQSPALPADQATASLVMHDAVATPSRFVPNMDALYRAIMCTDLDSLYYEPMPLFLRKPFEPFVEQRKPSQTFIKALLRLGEG